MVSRQRDLQRQWTAFVLTALMLAPLFTMTAPAAHAQLFGRPQTGVPKKGMSTGQKVLLVGGAALLYYLWRKHQANAAAKAQTNGAVAARQPQLYRSKNGGVYYRDAQGKAVWLTVPSQPVQVSQQDLQRYAPDYSRYNGPAPAAPQGYRTQQFSQFDPSAFGGAPVPAGVGNPPGPRRY